MPVRSAGLGTLAITLFTSGLALAQAPPSQAATPSPAPSTSGAPLPDEPPKLKVDDPMLAPMPPPKHVITSWEDAARMMRQRSTDLQSSYADIRRAEADSRRALAAVLPTLNGTGTASHTILPKASSG